MLVFHQIHLLNKAEIKKVSTFENYNFLAQIFRLLWTHTNMNKHTCMHMYVLLYPGYAHFLIWSQNLQLSFVGKGSAFKL